MPAALMKELIWVAGGIHLAIIVANAPLPARLKVRENLAGVPQLIRQVFYVHWVYIVIVLGLFAALCFGFAPELAGETTLGRFLSAFMAAFWLLRIVLQAFYYDETIRKENRVLDLLYLTGLTVLVAIFGMASLRPAP